MQAAAPDWLDRDVIACLEEKCGTLVDAVLIAYASGSVRDELHSLDVRDMSTFGGAPSSFACALLRPGHRVPVVRPPVAPWRDSELGLRLPG